MNRTRSISGLLGVALVIASTAGWTHRQEIDAYLFNKIGAPDATTAADVVTESNAPVVRLAVAGDVGTGEPPEFATAAAMDVLDEQYNFDALLLLGDNVYESGDPDQVQAKVLDPFSTVLDRGTALISVLGNHDVTDGNGPAQAAALGMPNNWYATKLDNTLVVSLDSNQTDNPDQLAWLQETLRDDTSQWVIAIMHHPAYSAGFHGSDASVQKNFVPLFERYGVDLVLAGHDHDYQRNKPQNGITYIVTGAAAMLRDVGRESFTEVSWSTYSFVDLAVYPDRIEGQAIDQLGRSIDTFTIRPR